jgi:hypothetical protein
MRFRIFVIVTLLGSAACTGDIMGGGDDDDDDGPAAVAFTAPAPGATEVRETLGDGGWLVAAVPVAVTSSGADTVEIVAGDLALGTVDDTGALTAALRALGPTTLTARAIKDGEVVAEATVDVSVVDPEVADCRGWLDLYQLTYDVGPSNQGVSDPVTLTTPINGVPYRYTSNTTPRATFFMDCTLALSLARAAPIFREHDVVEVQDIGVYNYRCIGNEGTPPDCPQGISQHAYAKAIDLAGFTLTDGASYTVLDDFVIDPDGDTCTAATEPGADTFLHELICALKGDDVWNIVLTPNYNDAHRNHFHVDMTDGADFIRKRDGAGSDD